VVNVPNLNNFFCHEGDEDHEEPTGVSDLFVVFISFMVSSVPYFELLDDSCIPFSIKLSK